jgi:hypothetical protein
MLFGDYAADCAKMMFGESGGRAIRHYRYATPDSWIVQRGAASGSDASAMRDVCQRIVANSAFAGRSFSSADEYIFLTSTGEAGPGNSTTWRAVNTTHHVTRVVADIGGVRGFALRRRAFRDLQEQLSLFRAA